MTTEEKNEIIKFITGSYGKPMDEVIYEYAKSKLEAKDKEIAELKSDVSRGKVAFVDMYQTADKYHQQITDLKAEIERLKGENDILEKTLSGSLKLAEAQAKQLIK